MRIMSQYWLLLIASFFGTASLEYISSEASQPETVIYPLTPNQYTPLPYVNYFNLHPSSDIEDVLPNTESTRQFYTREDEQVDLKRKKRSNDDQWHPNLVDKDKTSYYHIDDGMLSSPFVVEANDNATLELLEEMAKKNFSPWGGKRDKTPVEHAWSWKRNSNFREPNMPKRVRFSPWGGKRSGQILYKTGMKGSKIIFSTNIPELTRVVSNYSPKGERFHVTGLQILPTAGKRHPIEILGISTLSNGAMREALPFKTFIGNLPKAFKPGHTYTDVNLKKDGKRKLKFSAWGGKRSPPVIGPIWTPQDLKPSSLDAFLLIKNANSNKLEDS